MNEDLEARNILAAAINVVQQPVASSRNIDALADGELGWRCGKCQIVRPMKARAAIGKDAKTYCVEHAPPGAMVQCAQDGCNVLDCDEHGK